MPRLKGMPTPKTTRTMRALYATTAALIAILGLLFAGAPHAHARTITSPVYSGTGWQAQTARGIYSLNPDPYTIVFADSTARTMLAPYFTAPAAQVTTGVGVNVTVSNTLDTTPVSSCPPRHVIVVHYMYRPTGQQGMSEAYACYANVDHSAWGGHILIDNEYWTHTAWFSTNTSLNDAYRKNAVTHELGHILGLAHANTDLDGDGTVENYECVKNSAGWTPIMCSPNGGDRSSSGAGLYVPGYDLAGLKQMLANYYLRLSDGACSTGCGA